MIEIKSQQIDQEKLLKEVEYHIHRYKREPKKIERDKKNMNHNDFEKKAIYEVNDFCNYHNEEFIKNVYLGVLGREVDLDALNLNLSRLQSGKWSKTEILAKVRFSKEGRAKKVSILGIKKRFIIMALYRIPVIGYILKLLVALLTLPKIVERSNRFESQYFSHRQIDAKEMDKKVNRFDFYNEMSAIENLLLKNFQEATNFTKESVQRVDKDMTRYIQEVNRAKHYLREVERNLKTLIEKAQEKIEQGGSPDQRALKMILKEKDAMLDGFYVAFEDKFRGTREDIKSRQHYYLPLVQEVIKQQIGVVLDVGSGRGEWIELLQEHAIKAKGVDLNRLMVSESVSYGLDAIHQDAISYLKELPKESLSVITGFHIVEHLPFEVLISLFDESLRVLKKGGMIIFETPNPENILVGSCSFYTDPTHINPIPPVTLEFLATNRGFTDVKVHQLHPLKEAVYLEGKDKEDVNHLITALTKAQDYSIIGYKI